MKIGSLDVENPLELLECIVAFDSRDWFTDKRDRMIYAIVFGMDGCEENYREVGYTDEMIQAYKEMHKRFLKLKEFEFEN